MCISECATKYRQLCAIKKKREARIKEDYIKAHKRPKDFPRSRKDFDALFSQIASWKEAEVSMLGYINKFNLLNCVTKVYGRSPTFYRKCHSCDIICGCLLIHLNET